MKTLLFQFPTHKPHIHSRHFSISISHAGNSSLAIRNSRFYQLIKGLEATRHLAGLPSCTLDPSTSITITKESGEGWGHQGENSAKSCIRFLFPSHLCTSVTQQ